MKNIKFHIKYAVKLLIRETSKILYICPVKKNRIMFSSFYGDQITCNPKQIYDFLKENYSGECEYVWVYNGGKKDCELDENVKITKRLTLKWLYYSLTSKIVVDNIDLSITVPWRREQVIIQTWHAGGAYKKVGNAAVQRRIKYNLDKAMEAVDLFLSSSEGFSRENIREGYHYTGEILNCGMPRNDIFFDDLKIRKAEEKIRKTYALDGMIVLYAPTFRGGLGGLSEITEISNLLDMERLRRIAKEKNKVEVNILVRCHHWDKHKYRFSENVIDVANYPDMQELLCASDILITDYSSSMWDFALLGRPCLLYVPDVEEYIENRGFFMPIEQWPGIICKDMNELCDAIENLDENECAERAKKHLEMMGSYETGHATEIVCNKIMNYMK